MENERRLRDFVERYQDVLFALVLFLCGNDRDRAYETASDAFAEALRVERSFADEELLARVLGITLGECREAREIPASDEEAYSGLRSEKKRMLLIIRRALQSLPFEAKALVLLRDQARFPYRLIAAGLGLSEGEAKARTFKARGDLREKLAQLLNNK